MFYSILYFWIRARCVWFVFSAGTRDEQSSYTRLPTVVDR